MANNLGEALTIINDIHDTYVNSNGLLKCWCLAMVTQSIQIVWAYTVICCRTGAEYNKILYLT